MATQRTELVPDILAPRQAAGGPHQPRADADVTSWVPFGEVLGKLLDGYIHAALEKPVADSAASTPRPEKSGALCVS